MSNDPVPNFGIADDFPLLWQQAQAFDFAERSGSATAPLMAEIDRALRELRDARAHLHSPSKEYSNLPMSKRNAYAGTLRSAMVKVAAALDRRSEVLRLERALGSTEDEAQFAAQFAYRDHLTPPSSKESSTL